MTDEIHQADPRARIALLILVAGALALGGLLVPAALELGPGVEAWLGHDLGARVPILVGALALCTIGPLLGFAAYWWNIGRRTTSAGRYPPPGLWTLRDTPVVVGDAARQRGRLTQVVAVAIGISGLLSALFLWRLLALLGPAR